MVPPSFFSPLARFTEPPNSDHPIRLQFFVKSPAAMPMPTVGDLVSDCLENLCLRQTHKLLRQEDHICPDGPLARILGSGSVWNLG